MWHPHPPTTIIKGSTYDWFWVTVGTFVLYLIAHHSAFFSPYIINDDARQQLFWMQRWLDPNLYPPDLLNQYARLYVPWGVQGVYYLASFFMGPLAFSKILCGILYISTGTLIYLTGRQVGGKKLGLCILSIYWFIPFFLHAMSGGLARAFATPLLFFFLYGWLVKSRWIVALALLLQSLFIPYVFILCGGASGLAWIIWRLKLSSSPPFLVCSGDFLVAALACALLLGWKWQMSRAGFGPLPWQSEMVGNPEFSASGRFLILPVPSILHELFIRPFEFIAPFRDGNNMIGIVGVIVIIPVMIFGGLHSDWDKWRPYLIPLVCLATSSLLLYAAARILLFKLFLPSRYLEYSVNVGYCLVMGICLHGLIFNRLSLSNRKVAICLGLIFLLGCMRNTGIGLYDYSQDKALYTAVQDNTPVGAMIAGPPHLMDNVLTFGKRNVFASYELAHPWNMGYWSILKPRLMEFFEAYYSNDRGKVAVFCRKNRIDYLVVDKRNFAKEFIGGKPFFEPFGTKIKKLVDKNDRFALLGDGMCTTRINHNICILDTTALTGDTIR